MTTTQSSRPSIFDARRAPAMYEQSHQATTSGTSAVRPSGELGPAANMHDGDTLHIMSPNLLSFRDPMSREGPRRHMHAPFPARTENTASESAAYPTAQARDALSNRTDMHAADTFDSSQKSKKGLFEAPAPLAFDVTIISTQKPNAVLRIERDYIGGESCQFWSGFLWELEGRVSPLKYIKTIEELNSILASAHDPYKSVFDNCLAVLTLYLSPHIIGSHFQREMKRFEDFIERANRDIFNPVGLNLLSPRRTAFLFMEIEYY